MTPLQMAQILWLIEHVGLKADLDQVLEELYRRVRPIIPCNRLGLALLDKATGLVKSRAALSDRPILLRPGFTGSLAGSTLQLILEKREVRLINNLEQYLAEHPASVSTGLLVEEGMRSSLTCPLIVREEPVGFLFFTSVDPDAYKDAGLRFYGHIAAQLSLVIERARLYSELAGYAHTIENQNRQMNHDMDMARKLQQTFIPAAVPSIPGFDICLHYQPVMQVGGDILELVRLPDDRLLIFVADAMGHGVQAALVMAMLKGMLASMVASTQEPAQLMDRLNRSLRPLVHDYFAVAACIRIDPKRGVGRISRAGLPPPLLMNGASGEVRELDDGGMPLAVDEKEVYGETEFRFLPGDLLLVATDGLIESNNAADDEFGDDRLMAILRRSGRLSAAGLVSEVLAVQREFCSGHEQRDDMTVLALRRTGC